VSDKEEHAMWGKRLLRLLAVVYIVEGIVIFLAPESMVNFTRWFADNPRNMRLGGTLAIAAGILLALSQYQEEQPPQPWWRRWLD
jgi:uncharacterized protein YjeT (DUF2065 family)